MVRPQSIVRYERIYLLSFVLGLVASAMNWTARAAVLAANPTLAGQTWLLWATLVIGIVISLTLWHFTARNPSVVAKWIVTVFAAFAAIAILSAVYSLYRLSVDHLAIGPGVFVVLIANILYVVAAVMLFRPDSRQWFGEVSTGEEPFA